MDSRIKHPLIEGESPPERERRLRRIRDQRHKLKAYPNRKFGSRRKCSVVTKDYLLSQCKIDPTTGCWVWQKGRSSWGYGTIGENGKTHLVHRRAFEILVGPIPTGLDVLHRCDNPPCFNPEHLFLGTDQDNVDDREKKGRMPLGPNRPNAKLTADQVRTIRASTLSLRELSEIYGMTQAPLHQVRKKNTYKSVI